MLLQEILKEHGDIPVYMEAEGMNSELGVKDIDVTENDYGGTRPFKRIRIIW